MKTTKIFICLMLSILFAQAQKTSTTKTSLKEVVVYNTGAELTHTATATLVKGENEVVIKGLSPNISASSLKIEATGGVVVSAYELSDNFITEVKNSTKIQKLKDSIDLYNTKLQQIKEDIKTTNTLKDLLLTGVKHNISGEKEIGSTEKLTKNMEYYKKQVRELSENITSLNKKQTKISETLSSLKKQLDSETNSTQKQTSDLKISLSSPIALTTKFTIFYYTEDAGWEPIHNIIVSSEDKPINITTNAQVFQKTGLDWNNVKITLSTGKPNISKTAPEITTWFLKENRTVSNSKSRRYSKKIDYTETNLMVATEEEAELASADGLSSSATQTLYFVNGTSVSENDFNQIYIDQIKTKESLSETETFERFGFSNANAMLITTKEMEDYITQSDNQLNRIFDIDLTYNIPGNGKAQNIQLSKQQAEATYHYLCIPKIETEAYLITELQNWEKLNLLSGMANITFGNSFVGSTYIDAASTQKTLSLTLGVDKNIVITRKKSKDYSSVKILGSDNKITLTYQINVKNNKSKPIKITIKDQYPISTNKNYEVKLLDDTTNPTTKNESTGIITWDKELNSAQSCTYTISYSIKYPKNAKLNLE